MTLAPIVGGDDVFIIKRFDRWYDSKSDSYLRNHFVSGLTLLNLDEGDHAKWSYIDLADQMRRWITQPQNDLRELFKRIIFNGLISNTDDHPRNHGFLYLEKGYRLSPVYDLVPKPETGTTRYLAMSIGTKGRVFSKENLFSGLDAFDLKMEEAKQIFKEMQFTISKWRSLFKAENISHNDLLILEDAFSHWETL